MENLSSSPKPWAKYKKTQRQAYKILNSENSYKQDLKDKIQNFYQLEEEKIEKVFAVGLRNFLRSGKDENIFFQNAFFLLQISKKYHLKKDEFLKLIQNISSYQPEKIQKIFEADNILSFSTKKYFIFRYPSSYQEKIQDYIKNFEILKNLQAGKFGNETTFKHYLKNYNNPVEKFLEGKKLFEKLCEKYCDKLIDENTVRYLVLNSKTNIEEKIFQLKENIIKFSKIYSNYSLAFIRQALLKYPSSQNPIQDYEKVKNK